MSRRIFVILMMLIAVLWGSSLIAAAQQPQPPPQPVNDGERPQMPPRQPRPNDDPLGDVMFPPEMIMQHQRELALTDAQKQFMRAEIQRTTNRFNELQWELQDAMEALHETMKGSQVDEKQAMAQLDKVLDAEREIKAIHMQMNIRIKNQLTQDQQMKLRTMRNTFGPRDDKRGDRRPPDGGRPRPEGPDGMRPPGGLGGLGGGPRSGGGGRPGGPR